MSQFAAAFYFAFFILVVPVLGLIETPRRLPNSITQAVLGKDEQAGANKPA
jgi:ubiquinol-cytochrome c reductase cytochrome b subunit